MRGRRPDARLEPFADREVRFARPDEEWPTGRRPPVRQYSPPAHVVRRPRSRSPLPRSRSPLPPRRRSRERRSRSPPQRRARSPMPPHRDSPPPPRDFEREYYRYSPAPREFPEETYRFEPADERPDRFDPPEFRPEWPPEHLQGGAAVCFERPVEPAESTWQLQIFIGNEQPHPGLPEFSGENPESSSRQFLKLIDEIGNKENWTLEKRKKQFALKLVGAAKRWLLSGDGEKLVEFWGHLKTLFVKAFIDDMDYHYNLQQMINRTKRPDESYSNYFTCKLMLFKPLNITGRRAVSCLIGGLKLDDDGALYDHCFDSPELLYGHLMAEVDKPPNDPGSKQCFHCRKSDHKSRKCPEKRHKERDCPFVVKVNGYALNAVNDLRSQYVTIKEHQADLCGIRHNNHKLLVQGPGGTTVSSLGHAFANLEIDGVTVNIQMHVVPNGFQHHPVVLGEMLRRHPEVRYFVDDKGPKFLRKEVKLHVPLTSSFALNEKLVEKRGTSSGKAPPQQPPMQSGPSAADGHGNKSGRSSKRTSNNRRQ